MRSGESNAQIHRFKTINLSPEPLKCTAIALHTRLVASTGIPQTNRGPRIHHSQMDLPLNLRRNFPTRWSCLARDITHMSQNHASRLPKAAPNHRSCLCRLPNHDLSIDHKISSTLHLSPRLEAHQLTVTLDPQINKLHHITRLTM